jgi:hypothetical protein
MVISLFTRKARRTSRLSDIIKRSIKSVSSRRSLRQSSLVTNELFFYLYVENKDPRIRIFRRKNNEDLNNLLYYIVEDNLFILNVTSDTNATMNIQDSDKQKMNQYLNDNTIDCIVMLFLMDINTDIEKNSHSNMLIVNKKIRTVERFEPFSKDTLYSNLIDTAIEKNIMKLMPSNYRFTSNVKIPCRAFQLIQQLEKKSMRKSKRPGGFCSTWAVVFALYRINNLDKTMYEVDEILGKKINAIKFTKASFTRFIEDFTAKYLEKVEKFLSKSGVSLPIIRKIVRDPSISFSNKLIHNPDKIYINLLLQFIIKQWNKYS